MDFIIWIAVYAYGSLAILAIKERAVGQNILTWVLWTILDVFHYFATDSQQGDSADALQLFTIGGVCITLLLFILKADNKWGKTETIIVTTVPICIFVWLGLDNPQLSLIGLCAAQFIAGIPLLKETRENPEPWYILPNLGFMIINIYYLTNAKSWKIEDSLLSEVLIVYGLIIHYFLWKELLERSREFFKNLSSLHQK